MQFRMVQSWYTKKTVQMIENAIETLEAEDKERMNNLAARKAQEEARKKAVAERLQKLDEDGFITVGPRGKTRGGSTNP